jgi:hypothetical protein
MAPYRTRSAKLLARQIHRHRMIRSLKFIKPYLSTAVTYYYHEQGWIEETDIPWKRYVDRDDPSSTFRDDDAMVDDTTTNDSDTDLL